MKKGTTDITVVLDRSGSMESIKSDVIGGFNNFLKEQMAVPGQATITLVQFDDEYQPVYQGLNLQDAPKLDDQTFVPRGSTALLDAIGRTINATGDRLRKIPEPQRPEQVVFVILTDGQENASKKYTMDRISEMIRHQTDVYKWNFVFLGANQDAIASACALGIGAHSAMNFTANAMGVRDAYSSVSASVASFRAGKAKNVAFGKVARSQHKKVSP